MYTPWTALSRKQMNSELQEGLTFSKLLCKEISHQLTLVNAWLFHFLLSYYSFAITVHLTGSKVLTFWQSNKTLIKGTQNTLGPLSSRYYRERGKPKYAGTVILFYFYDRKRYSERTQKYAVKELSITERTRHNIKGLKKVITIQQFAVKNTIDNACCTYRI